MPVGVWIGIALAVVGGCVLYWENWKSPGAKIVGVLFMVTLVTGLTYGIKGGSALEGRGNMESQQSIAQKRAKAEYEKRMGRQQQPNR